MSISTDLVIKTYTAVCRNTPPTLVRTFFYILVSLTTHTPLLYNRIWCEVHYLISEATRSADDTPSFTEYCAGCNTSSECGIYFAFSSSYIIKILGLFVIIWLCYWVGVIIFQLPLWKYLASFSSKLRFFHRKMYLSNSSKTLSVSYPLNLSLSFRKS